MLQNIASPAANILRNVKYSFSHLSSVSLLQCNDYDVCTHGMKQRIPLSSVPRDHLREISWIGNSSKCQYAAKIGDIPRRQYATATASVIEGVSEMDSKLVAEIKCDGKDIEDPDVRQGFFADCVRPYFEKQCPVVLRGLNSYSSCKAYEEWSDVEYLRMKVGADTSCEVEIMDSSLGGGLGYASSTSKKSTIAFGDYCDYLVLAKRQYENDNTSNGESMPTIIYLAQNEVFHGLRGDYDVPSFCEDPSYKIGRGSLDYQMIWIGPAGCLSPLHFDPLSNIFMQYVGTKRFFLYPSTQEIENGSIHDCFYAGGNGQYNTSQVDIEKPDLNLYPKFQDAPQPYFTTVGPGDALFIPKQWWHHVRSLEHSVSLNIFWK